MIKENLEKIFNKINSGNNLGEKITLVGATKTVSVENINEAVRCGLKICGDNKVQEFRDKSPLISGADFHFIGHLQTNKVKYLIGKVSLIQSVDSEHLALAISSESVKKGVTTNILAEINIGGELSKSGFNPQNAFESVKMLASMPNIKVLGLMAMLPKTDNTDLQKKLCLQMRNIYDKMKSDGYPFEYLSMGMSADYEVAIKNGSNMIRLGSSIFGQRVYSEVTNGII